MKKILKSIFCDGSGQVFMPYVYSFIFIVLIVIFMIVRLLSPLGSANKENISDALIGILFGGVLGLITVSTWGKKNNNIPSASSDLAIPTTGGIIDTVKDVVKEVKDAL